MFYCFAQAEVCSGTVAEVIQSVVNGADGCIFCFGHVKVGKLFLILCGLLNMIPTDLVPQFAKTL